MRTALRISPLPKGIVGCTLSDLSQDESAYIAPSALLVTSQQRWLLRTDAPIRRRLDAMFSLHVRRTAGGYIADITYCTYQWTPTDRWDDTRYALVEHLIFADEFLW